MHNRLSGNRGLRVSRRHGVGSHQLTKSPGSTINATWQVTNEGDGQVEGRLEMAVGSQTTSFGDEVEFSPGETRTLSVGLTLSLPPGLYGAVVAVVQDIGTGNAVEGGEHQFVVTVEE